MLRRVVFAVVSTCAVAAGLSDAAKADDCWIDVTTGRQVQTMPTPVAPEWRRVINEIPSGQVHVPGGASYSRMPDGSWIDVATGRQVQTMPTPVAPEWRRVINEIPSGQVHVPGGASYVRVPCPPSSATATGGVEVSTSLGIVNTSTSFTSTGFFSAGGADAVTDNKERASGTGFIGGVGASAALGSLTNPFAAETGVTMRYAPEAQNAYAAYFPLKAPPKPAAPRWTWGIDGNVYFFAGGDQTINGIPGGPFGTATGLDSFKVSNNVLLTVGGWITAPLTPTWNVSLTGGFAELNQTVKYNCVSFCNVAPATAQFTASQDKWMPGAYVGGRLSMPLALAAWRGANIGIDYKHVFFGSYDVSLGAVATRQVNARLSPDMDLVTVRLGVPLR